MKFYLLICTAFFLCNPNAFAQTDHWESVILPGDPWRYLVPTEEPITDWRQPAFDDTSWPTGISGIGYGDGDDATVIQPTIALYMRMQFTVHAIEDISSVLLDMDFDDGFVAYLNGQEIARALVSGENPAFDQFADADQEAMLYQGLKPNRFVIDQQFLLAGNNHLAIQVHNWSAVSSDLTAIPVLSFGINTDSYQYRATPEWFDVPQATIEFESSNLPIVIINTENNQEIPNEPKINGRMTIIDNGPGVRNFLSEQGNAASLDFDGPIKIEVRGSSSSLLPKKQYALTTYDVLNEKDNVSLLGMPSENDWVLNGLAYDPSLMRDFISYRMSRNIGQYASRGVYCEMILNGEYRGLYVLQEKLKADNNRIDINKIKPEDNSGKALTGGYITKSDKTEGDDIAAWEMPNYAGWKTAFIHEHPNPTTVTVNQNNYIRDEFYRLANLSAAQNSSLVNGYPSVIDLPSFIDFMIINELVSNPDAYQFSTFFHKDRNGKLRAGPVWDLNLSYGNDLFFWGYDRSLTNVWQFDDQDNVGAMFWKDLFDDDVFHCYLARRWNQLIQPGMPLHPTEIYHLIEETSAYIAEAIPREEQTWGTIGDHAAHIQAMKTWVAARVEWMSRELGAPGTCTGSEVPALTITKINYHPLALGDIDEKDFEFIEITNTGSTTADLTGVYFGGTGLVYQFPAATNLAAGQSVFLANETTAFMLAYGFQPFDEFSRALGNGGQTIQLLNGYGNLIDEVSYEDQAPWPEAADGDGYYLALIDPALDNNDPANWEAVLTSQLLGVPQSPSPVIQLYPNPAVESVTILMESVIKMIRVWDLDGKVQLIETPQQTEVLLPLSALNSGIYLIEIESVNGRYFRKLRVE